MGQSPEAPDHQQKIGLVVACLILTFLVMVIAWFTTVKKNQKRTKDTVEHSTSRLPPGPKGWPIVGALPYVTGPRHVALQKLAQEYGPLIFMYLGSVPTLVVSNATMAKEFLKTNDRATASRWDFKSDARLFYDSQDLGFSPYGSHWRKVRRICSLRLFTTSRLNRFQNKRRDEVQAMAKDIFAKSQDGEAIQMIDTFESLTMNVITQMMWNKSHCGGPGNNVTFQQFSREVNEVMGKNIGDFIPSLSWLSMHVQGLGKRIDALHKRWDDFVQSILEEHKQERSYSKVGAEPASDAADFVDVLLDHTAQAEDDADKISEITMKGLLTDMVVAGTDTMAITLEWALAYLIKQPSLLKRAQDEVMDLVGSNKLVTEEDAFNLPYLSAILKETMRLHPPTPLALPHMSVSDFEVDGFHVPANSLVFINLWAIQRDPEVWERPDDFNPDRFLGDREVDWKGQNFDLIPFGSGRRMCPAINLATNVLHLAFAQVLHTFDWSLPEGQKPEEMDMSQRIGFQSRKAVPPNFLTLE